MAEIAQRRLTPEAAATAQKVLGRNYSFASISSWADDVRDARPKTYNWHFVGVPLAVDTYDPGRECEPDPSRGDRVLTELERARKDILSAPTDAEVSPWLVIGRTAAVDRIPITDQVARSLSPREWLCDLTCDPFRRRMWCDVDSEKAPALQSNDGEDIVQVEANGRSNNRSMAAMSGRTVTQEGTPSLGERLASLDHILGDAGLSDLKAELEQLAKHMALSILSALERPQCACSLYVDHGLLALFAYFASSCGGLRFPSGPIRGGLAPWQERRAKEILHRHLAAPMAPCATGREGQRPSDQIRTITG